MEPNEAMKAMARRIVNANSNYMDGLNRGQCNFSAQEVLAIALAAIMETQRLDVALAEQWIPMPGNARQMKGTYAQGVFDVAQAIRTGEHYALAGDRHG